MSQKDKRDHILPQASAYSFMNKLLGSEILLLSLYFTNTHTSTISPSSTYLHALTHSHSNPPTTRSLSLTLFHSLNKTHFSLSHKPTMASSFILVLYISSWYDSWHTLSLTLSLILPHFRFLTLFSAHKHTHPLSHPHTHPHASHNVCNNKKRSRNNTILSTLYRSPVYFLKKLLAIVSLKYSNLGLSFIRNQLCGTIQDMLT